MKIFSCGNCRHQVYFENVRCGHCGHWLAYYPEGLQMVALAPGGSPWQPFTESAKQYVYCNNHQHKACNWLIEADTPSGLCQACDLNHTIPDLSDPVKLGEWRRLEMAKHRLVYSLLRLQLPVRDRMEAPERGLAFDFLADVQGEDRVMTGHDDGLITLNIEEADPVTRETNRVNLHEKYRTLIGHFRHEVGHYYWDQLVFTNPALLREFREIFGDERADYGDALEEHYAKGAPTDWARSYISTYATSHPWEDWAETWAHYLHILDMLETASAFGLSTDPGDPEARFMRGTADFDPYADRDIERILNTAVPLVVAINSLNRGMGRPDLYPFVLNGPVRSKLGFINKVVGSAAA